MNKVEVRSDCGGWKDKGKLISLNVRDKTITVRFEGKVHFFIIINIQ